MLFKRLILIGIPSLISLHLVGWFLLNQEINSKVISAGLWQTNIPIRKKFSQEDNIKTLKRHVKNFVTQETLQTSARGESALDCFLAETNMSLREHCVDF